MDEKKTRVMMIDDEKFLLNIYKASFEKDGYEVQAFSDVDAALTALRGDYEPEVILFDLSMPDSKSGFEFIETVTQEHLAPGALKIALTNEGADGAREHVLRLGADEYLLKVQHLPHELATKVTELSRARRLAEENK